VRGVSTPDDEVQVLDRGRLAGVGRVNTGTVWTFKVGLSQNSNMKNMTLTGTQLFPVCNETAVFQTLSF